MPLTEADVKSYVETSLGAPVVRVELDTTHYELSMERTLRDFSRFRPKEVVVGLHAAQGVSLVTYPPTARGLLWVEFLTDEQTLDGIDIESAMLSNPWAFISTGTPSVDVFSYELQRHWLEVLGRSFGNEPDYYNDADSKRVYFHCPMAMKVTLTWAAPWADVSEIPGAYDQLFLDLTLAKARQILGQIRGKYSGVPGASGTIQLDGEYQLRKGETDERELVSELRSLGSGYLVPQVG